VIELSSYALSILREGEFTLYRGYADGLDPILLVAPDSDTSEIASIGRFQHEYALRTALDSRWAARPIALSRYRDRMALVLDDPGGEPLDRLLAQPLDLRHFLRIAIPLAAACRQMHAYGIIHKDIKPSNVLVDTDGGRVRLMGFGIASRSRREHQDAAPPEVIAGTLAYMAPEQTGRMNRSIDSRSDLYALGATFYEMLTGAPPFTAGDPMELMHAHIARQAVPPHQRLATVPELISSIVMKLLAKTMEERYQTAAGIEADLRRCLAEWEAHGRVAPFPLGTHDASDQLQIPEKLYGREREIEMLVAAFDRVVASGMPELVLVSGYPGIGKSSVVNALRKALGPQHVLFAAGKFDQYKRDIPYAILAQAFQDQIRSILGRDDAELARWRDAIGSALGPNGRLIVNLIPELELVIGPQPPPPDLPPLEAQNRFQTVFRRFIAVFARPERPLVLFLDDLQWLDRATLDLMQHIVAHEGVRHLMVVGAYRDNEVSPTHPLISALNEIRGAGTPIHEIVLSPLGLDDVGLLIAEALGCDEERARPLAQLVHDKAGGNPFFTIQFLTELAEEQLLTFDHEAAAWTWDLPRIHQKGYTDNILDLMGGKLNRLPAPSQEALKQFARLGNVADFATLALLQGQSEDALHAALSDVVRSGLLIRTNNAYRFAHDRVHEAAYTLTAEADRAQAHLRIGRRLAENLSPRQIAESVFDIVNQFNAGHELIRDRGEMDRVAELNLQAGQRAKAGTAYASAVRYLSVGMDLLGKEAWVRRYDLAFALWIEAAECEYLNGDFEKTERLISEVLSRARSNVDRAAAYRIMIIFHSARGEYHDAIARGLECLRLFGIVLSARATHADVLAEYQRILGNLGQRSIGDLIDLPLMTHPEMQAVVRILTFLFAPASLLNNNLFYMLICSAANLTLRYGVTEASIHIYSGLAQILGPVFHRYEDGLRFAVLARGTAEKYRFVETKAYFAMECASVWSRPIQTAIDFIRLTFRAAIETSDLSYACYSCIRLVSDLLVQGAHLDEVWSESEKGLAFVRRVKFRAPEDILISQQQLIRQLRGEADESPGSDAAPFNEEDFVARLTAEGHTTLVCWYWILQLQARYISGDFEIARSAADHAAALLWATEAFIYSADYCYYRALTVAALHRPGRLQENSAAVLETLYGHLKQLREWADACPETFVNRYVLVAAEIARLEGRELDAERSYEEAIRSARKHGFVQNEAIANEVAARFHVSRGFETIANTYLRNARSCYLRWGAAAKARRLEQSHPQLREGSSARSATTIGEPIEHLDVATVVKASQAVSGEIVLDKLVETLMTIALEHAGAERGMLVLLRDNKLQIEAEAATGTNSVDVVLRPRPSTSVSLPESLLQTVMRTRERVIIDDARRPNPFAEDVYVLRQRPRSVLCLPLLKQAKLIGLIYLENNLAPATFTPQRIAVLELLASQAAISLENAGLYAELIAENRERRKAEEALRASEASLAEAQRISRTGNWRWNVRTGAVHWSAEHFVIFGVDPAVEQPSYAVYLRCVHPEDVPVLEQTISRAARETSSFKHEYRIVLRDGSIKYVQSTGHPVNTAGDVEFVGTVMDITERRRAEEALRRAQEELARVSRLSTMGELAGSIIHEISQPLAAIVTNAEACLRWLNRDVPDLDEARDAVSDLARAGRRAADVVKSLKTLARKSGIELTKVDLNDAIQEVLAVLRNELERGRVVLNVELFAGDRPVLADRIQLQQVLLNLIRNAIEAMSTVTDRARKLRISWQPTDNGEALVAVEDSGTGLEADAADRVFEPLFTTKPEGMGMGLSICRSIVDAHRGRLWASLCLPHGTVFRFTVPFADVAH
jgi:predicted ATPase/signal transduction histidine kinase/GAF domain-containing protein